MAQYPVDWVDAFANTAFAGNGCAVVYDDGVLGLDTCLAFVRETSLVECTFVGPSDVAAFKVRYFVATHEIPFAGHPTIATIKSLLHRGKITGPRLSIETGAGVIDIEVSKDGLIQMRQIAPSFGAVVPAEDVAELMGLTSDEIVHPPQLVSTGLSFCITVVKNLDALRRAKLDPDKLEAFLAKHTPGSAEAGWPYLIVRESPDDTADTLGRLLLAPPMPPEDPFTGSATGAAAAYLWHHGLIETSRYVAGQGDGLGRPGRANVEVLGPREAIEGVLVSGHGHVLMSGDLMI